MFIFVIITWPFIRLIFITFVTSYSNLSQGAPLYRPVAPPKAHRYLDVVYHQLHLPGAEGKPAWRGSPQSSFWHGAVGKPGKHQVGGGTQVKIRKCEEKMLNHDFRGSQVLGQVWFKHGGCRRHKHLCNGGSGELVFFLNKWFWIFQMKNTWKHLITNTRWHLWWHSRSLQTGFALAKEGEWEVGSSQKQMDFL